jgi:hypothetical protein
MRSAISFLVIGLAIGCRSSSDATHDASPSTATATANADDEGIVVTLTGPPEATYTGAGRSVTAGADGHAVLVLAKDALPGEKLVLAVRGAAKPSLEVALPALAPPVVAITAEPSRAPGQYAIDAKCGGDCAGTATFLEGRGVVHLTGTTGCTLHVAGESWKLDQTPARDPAGALLRSAKDVSVSVVQATNAGKLPDVLADELDVLASFDCPDLPARALHLRFAAGAAVTAVWGRYQFVGAEGVKRSLGDHDRSSAVVVLDSDGFMSGLDLPHELVRFYGAPKATEEVELVGKLTELRRKRRERCQPDAGAPFEVEVSDLALDVFDGDDRRIAHTVIHAPPIDCLVLGPRAPVRVFVGEGYDVRVWRPDAAAIDRAMKKYLRP